MPEAHSSQSSFPLTQRELVGLALAHGARRPAAPHSQCERVRLALALGVGGTPKGAGPAERRGTYR